MDTTTEKNINYQDVMLKFNSDPDFIKLRDRYATKSFLEIMATDRSENRHSSFLAWLLEGKEFPVKDQDHPIVHLLDILIRRSQEQSRWAEEANNIKTIILSRNIKCIHIDEISTEKTISQVSTIQSADRLDIYVQATIVSKNGTEEKIEFFIENKVGSKENGEKAKKVTKVKGKVDDKKVWDEYSKKEQTNRYYFACKEYTNNDMKNKFFVYLTPISNDNLSAFDDIGMDQKSKSEYFININYQDVLDYIIEPLLDSCDLSNRIRMILEEYVLSLSLPAEIAEDDNGTKIVTGSIIMATRQSDVEDIRVLINKKGYFELIKDSLDAVTNNKNTSDVLTSFGITYKNLFTAILRIYLETSSGQEIEKQEELQILYSKLLGTPRDNTKFSFGGNNIMGKCAFAVQMLKWLLEYKLGSNTPNEGHESEWCLNIQDRYWKNNPNKRLWMVLYAGWYDKQDPEKLVLNTNAPEDVKLKEYVEKKRYAQYGNYWVTNQWGLDQENNKSTFDLLLKEICGSSLTEIKKENKNKNKNRRYSVSDLKNDWKDVLEKANVSKITIHLQ